MERTDRTSLLDTTTTTHYTLLQLTALTLEEAPIYIKENKEKKKRVKSIEYITKKVIIRYQYDIMSNNGKRRRERNVNRKEKEIT
jgi:hypothetical protein